MPYREVGSYWLDSMGVPYRLQDLESEWLGSDLQSRRIGFDSLLGLQDLKLCGGVAVS